MNSDSETGSGNAGTLTIEPSVSSRTAALLGGAAGDWLCAWCLSPIADDADRFAYQGNDQFTFSNPDGMRFTILTFAKTRGCRQTGTPTLAHTWFDGHAWSFCECESCGRHLGWYYAGPHQFAGLIIPRIVKAQCLRN